MRKWRPYGSRTDPGAWLSIANMFPTEAGTIYSEIQLPAAVGTTQAIIDYGSGTTTFYNSSGSSAVLLRDGTNIVTATLPTAATRTKYAASYGGSALNMAKDGTLSTAGSFDGSMNPGANFGIGYDPSAVGNQLFGNIRNVRIAQAAFGDTTLQALTA